MKIRSIGFAFCAALLATPVFAGPSGQHSAASADHSAKAASHGAAAVVSGAATVAAVPIVAFGSALAVSGAALQGVGEGAIATGSELSRVGTMQPHTTHVVAPMGAPTLD